MKDVRIVFLGTPLFAATILQGLINNHYHIVGVVSQPDKRIGKNKMPSMTPVKEIAVKNHIDVFQPVKLKDDYQFLIDLQPDLLITCAYGQILPQAVLDIAKINNINVHASLLPKLRGGAPIHRAIINGDTKTGVTIMQMIKQMDAGCMYAKKEVEIDENINTTQLFEKLQVVGRDLLIETLPSIINRTNLGVAQNEKEATYAYNIYRSEEKIDFHKTCKEVHNLIRGLSVTPGAYCLYHQKVLKIYQTELSDLKNDGNDVGSLMNYKKDLYVKCSDGYLKIVSLQLEGKKATDGRSFINGQNVGQVILL